MTSSLPVLPGQRGATLVEALVATLLTAALAVGALGALTGLQRRAAGEVERIAMRGTLQTAAQLLLGELANLDPAAGDLLAMAPDRITYRAVRGTGVRCGSAVDGVVLRASAWRSLRLPAPGRDSVLTLVVDGSWSVAPLIGPPRAGPCADGTPGLVLPTGVPAGAVEATAIRTFEVMELRVYLSGGERWLGLRSVTAGETIQPVAGPLASAAPFRFQDASGAPVAGPAEVRQLRVDLAALSAMASAAGTASRSDRAREDTLAASIGLRGGAPP